MYYEGVLLHWIPYAVPQVIVAKRLHVLFSVAVVQDELHVGVWTGIAFVCRSEDAISEGIVCDGSVVQVQGILNGLVGKRYWVYAANDA